MALHNFLSTENDISYTEYNSNEMTHTQLQGISQQGGNKSSNMACKYRDEFKGFFSSNGAVPWQVNAVRNFNT